MIALFLLMGMNLFAQNYNLTKSYDKSFALKDHTEVSLMNKYGDIQIIHWDKDSVRIQVKVEVNSHKEAKAEKLFQAIQINFKSTNFYVHAETELIGKNSVWNEITDKTKQIFNAKTTSNINYTVYLPNSTKLNMQNKYGHIFMGDYVGELNIEMSNGDLKAHHIKGKSKLKVSFGDLFIYRIENAYLETTYAEAEIGQIAYLETNTSTSKFYIEELEELNIFSSHDKYYIGQLSKISGKGRFSLIRIKNLDQEINLKMEFGALHLRGLSSALQNFQMSGYKTDIHLALNYEDAYQVEFRYKEAPQFQFPVGEYEKSETVVDQDSNLKSLLFIRNSSKSDQSKQLNISSEEGNVFMTIK